MHQVDICFVTSKLWLLHWKLITFEILMNDSFIFCVLCLNESICFQKSFFRFRDLSFSDRKVKIIFRFVVVVLKTFIVACRVSSFSFSIFFSFFFFVTIFVKRSNKTKQNTWLWWRKTCVLCSNFLSEKWRKENNNFVTNWFYRL